MELGGEIVSRVSGPGDLLLALLSTLQLLLFMEYKAGSGVPQ